MSELSIEVVIWVLAYLVGSTCIWVSYARGATAWEKKFSFRRQDKSGEPVTISGRWGELLLNSFWLGGIALIAVFCRDAKLSDLSGFHWVLVSTSAILVTIGVVKYSKGVVADETEMEEKQIDELRRGYDYYRVFAVIFYLGALIAILKIVLQFYFDVKQFFVFADDLIGIQEQSLRDLAGSIDLNGMLMLERLYIEYNALNRSIIRQLEPIVMFVIYVMVVLLVVAQTPIRHSFHADAKQIGYYASLCSILLVFCAAAGVYYFQYADFASAFLSNIYELIGYSFSDFSYLSRLSTILDEILDFSGFSGFLRIFVEEGGIYIIALALAQIASSVVSKRVEELSR